MRWCQQLLGGRGKQRHASAGAAYDGEPLPNREDKVVVFLGRRHPVLDERHCVKPSGTAVFTKLAWSPAPLELRVEDSVCRQMAETLREKGNRRRRRGRQSNGGGRRGRENGRGIAQGYFLERETTQRRVVKTRSSPVPSFVDNKREKKLRKKDTRWRRVIVYCGSIVLFPQSSSSHLARSSLYSSAER